ncbi:MAG: hypothetical protein LBJ14_01125 [Desulfarculales bacterium]|jgi:hypothetical protein|nr:hypothetical protein [Desulfarculales bacterium]
MRLFAPQGDKMASTTRPPASKTASSLRSNEFTNMLKEIAEEAERTPPSPPPQVQKLQEVQKKRQRRWALVLLAACLALGGILFYGIKYPSSMPLGLGGIFKAYVDGAKTPLPENQPGD